MSKFVLGRETSLGKLYFHDIVHNANPNGIISPRSILWTGFADRAMAYNSPGEAVDAARKYKIAKHIMVEPAFLPKIEGTFTPAQ